jgi:hypothetical protein
LQNNHHALSSCEILTITSTPGVYILEKYPPPPPLGEKKYQPMSFGGKNIKRGREKGGGKCRRKRKKGEKRKENEK